MDNTQVAADKKLKEAKAEFDKAQADLLDREDEALAAYNRELDKINRARTAAWEQYKTARHTAIMLKGVGHGDNNEARWNGG